LKEVKGPIDLEKFVKPVPDANERRYAEKGEYPPYMIDGRKALVVSVLLKKLGNVQLDIGTRGGHQRP
jgi:hypothetical protein